jgi:hypothetical protein
MYIASKKKKKVLDISEIKSAKNHVLFEISNSQNSKSNLCKIR